MRILLAAALIPLAACDIAQQAAEEQIRAEVSNRVDEAEGALRNRTGLDERYGNVANAVLEGEAGVRARAEGEIDRRVRDAVNQAAGQ
jgi:CHASE1-domain containing sensor protein